MDIVMIRRGVVGFGKGVPNKIVFCLDFCLNHYVNCAISNNRAKFFFFRFDGVLYATFARFLGFSHPNAMGTVNEFVTFNV